MRRTFTVAGASLAAIVVALTTTPLRTTAAPVVAPSPAPTADITSEVSLVPTVDIVTLEAAKDAYHGLATDNLDKKSLAKRSVATFTAAVTAQDASVLGAAGTPTAFVLTSVETDAETTTYVFRVESTVAPVIYRYTIDTGGKDARRIVGLSVAPAAS